MQVRAGLPTCGLRAHGLKLLCDAAGEWKDGDKHGKGKQVDRRYNDEEGCTEEEVQHPDRTPARASFCALMLTSWARCTRATLWRGAGTGRGL